MKTEHLHDVWGGPDNTRLTSKQFSFRFPVHIAAKIAALCEMYPTKNRTQIVADLLTAALNDLEEKLPRGLGDPYKDEFGHQQYSGHPDDEMEPIYWLGGARGRFRDLASTHYQELEKELGNENPEPLYPAFLVTESDLKQK